MMGLMEEEFRLPLVRMSAREPGQAAEDDESVRDFEMTRVIITGSKGRMGQALLACAPQHRELEVVGQIDQGDDLAADHRHAATW